MTATRPLTRRQFYARMRKLGFAKGLQFARNGVSYSKHNAVYSVDEGIIQVPVPCPPRWWGVTARTVTVTVPKRHAEQFHIIGDVPVSGIYVLHPEAGGKAVAWATHFINPADFGCENMFEVCLGLCDGSIDHRCGAISWVGGLRITEAETATDTWRRRLHAVTEND